MSIQFVVDSASDILPTEAAALGVRVLPLQVIFGGKTYRDGVDLSHEVFYQMLEQSKELPTTSQVSPGDFSDVFRELTQQGHTVIAITVSSQLSGTWQSAMIAAEDFPGQVFVVDSGSAAIGQRILLQRGLELVRQGLSAEETVGQLEKEKTRIRVIAMIDTLDYLKKGGRISAATALAGSVLSVKPAIEIREGLVAMAGKARGIRQGNALLRQKILDYGGVNFEKPYAFVSSGQDDSRIRQFLGENKDLWLGKPLPVCSLGCAIGTHVGPGAWGIAFFEE